MKRFFLVVVFSGVAFLVWSQSLDLPEGRSGYEGISAGAITVPPVEYLYQRAGETAAGTVVATEDRRLRLLDGAGEVIAEYRTGIHRPLTLLDVGGGVLRIFGPAGEDMLIGYRQGDFVGMSRVQNPRSPGGLPSQGAVPRDAMAVYVDGSGNFYSLSEPGVVTYGSAGGVRLWRRPLPARATTQYWDGRSLYVGLGDGRIFRFLTDGNGGEVLRLRREVADITVVIDEGEIQGVCAIDSTGRLYVAEPPLRGMSLAETLSISWSRDLFGEYSLDQWRFPDGVSGSDIVVFSGKGRAVAFDLSGEVRWSRAFSGDGRLYAYTTPDIVVIDGNLRLSRFSPDGSMNSVMQLPYVPQGVTVLPVQRKIFLEYPQWRYAALSLTDTSEGLIPPISIREEGVPDIPRETALQVLVEATLDSPSESQRSQLLAAFQSRIEEQRMFGVLPTVRSALVSLTQEVYRGYNPSDRVSRKDFPLLRGKAVEILALIGDRPSRRALSEVVRYDPDANVVAAALEGIARSGRDEPPTLEWGIRRFRDARGGGREAIARALLMYLEGVLPIGMEDRTELFHQGAIEIVSSNVSRELRERAALIGRRW